MIYRRWSRATGSYHLHPDLVTSSLWHAIGHIFTTLKTRHSAKRKVFNTGTWSRCTVICFWDTLADADKGKVKEKETDKKRPPNVDPFLFSKTCVMEKTDKAC